MKREIEVTIKFTIMSRPLTIITDIKRLFTRFEYGFVNSALKQRVVYNSEYMPRVVDRYDPDTFVKKLIKLRDEEAIHSKRMERRRCRGSSKLRQKEDIYSI